MILIFLDIDWEVGNLLGNEPSKQAVKLSCNLGLDPQYFECSFIDKGG